MDFCTYLSGLVKQIPPGRVSTYTHLAQALGDARARKAVKETLEIFHDSNAIPWHRVIEDNGTIQTERQQYLLQQENIIIYKKVIPKYKDIVFPHFTTTYPLKKLRQTQLLLHPNLDLQDSFTTLDSIGGADVSYQGSDAYAAYVAWIIIQMLLLPQKQSR